MASPSQKQVPMLPEREFLQQREVGEILRKVLRARTWFIPIVAVFLTLVVIYDRAPWKTAALGAVLLLQVVVFGFDLFRLKRDDPRLFRYFGLDLGLMIVLQTCAIWLTGGIESPLVVIYVPLGVVAAVVLGPRWQRWMVVGGISFFLWSMTLLGLAGLAPRTVPSFLDLGPGFYDRPVYTVTKATILNLVVLVGSFMGVAIHRAIHRMLDAAIHARQQALDSLADRNRELVHLSGAIAHELKNPLASIQGLVQLLDRPGAGGADRQAARLQVLRSEVTRMRETLDEFLNFTRPLGDLTVQEVQVAGLLDEITSLHEGLARAREIRVLRPGGPLRPLGCDGRKVKQALVNLVQNALEATPRGGTVEWIARASDDETGLAIGVRDSGPGIPADLLGRLSQAGVTTKPGGSGIGLCVARAIAEQHGGKLTLENRPGGGCEALLHLPLRPRTPPSATSTPARADQSEAAAGPGSPTAAAITTAGPEEG